MKKKFLFLMTLLAVSLLALAEMSIFVYQKNGEKVEYLAANVDSIGFVNFHTIVFDANGGDGSMDALPVKESESVNLPANIFTKSAFAFTAWNTAADGSGTAYADQASITPKANITLYAQWKSTTSGIADGHEWVDLGLPSGTKWATINVGATKIEEQGDLFAWGETEPKTKYDWSTYKWGTSSAKMTKYNTDRLYGWDVDMKLTLDIEDDAASVNWGGTWRMPTSNEINELVNNCTSTVETKNGVTGYLLTSEINGAQIFMPGFPDISYWSSSLDSHVANRAIILWGYYMGGGGALYKGLSINNISRANGNLIRPVLP